MKYKKCCQKSVRNYKRKLLRKLSYNNLRPLLKYRTIKDWQLTSLLIKIRRIIKEKYLGDKI